MNANRLLISFAALAAFAGCATAENIDPSGGPSFDASVVGAGGGASGATNGGATDTGGLGGSAGGGGNSGGATGGGANTGGSSPDGSASNGGTMSTGGAGGAAGGDGGSPPACSDPTKKSCNGACTLPSPAVGCDFTSCTPCGGVTNGFPQCTASACDFGCYSGYQRSGSACVAGSGGTGGTTGAGGSTGGGGCSDATKDGAETDVDCGGGTCPPCADKKRCSGGGDCASGVCKSGGFLSPKTCQSATCSDGVRNGAETDVDCGGNCGATCIPGKTCTASTDCSKGPCNSGVCGCTALTCAGVGTQCGQIADNCGGNITCTCGASQVCNAGQCCTPITACTALQCGSIPNGCGGTFDCGVTACGASQVCTAGACCTPLTACAAGQCGTISDGCLGTVTCPTCASPQTCAGAGIANQCGCGDADSDGIDDCTEINDGDPWTDPAIFNGLEAMLDTDGGGNCNELSDYETMSTQFRAPAEQHNVYSGWDFSTNDDAANAPGFGFKPAFASSDTGFRVRYRGQINLPQDGEYCFKVDAASTGGGTPDECVQVYVDQAPGPGGKWLAQNGYNGPASQQVGCVTVTAGVYPIDLVFQSANTGHLHTFHPTFCFGGAAACTPTTPLTQKYFRPPSCVDSSECQCEYYGGHAYRMCRTNRAWAAAQTQCTTAGMKMVRLDSAAEDLVVYGTMNARGSNTAWIGGSDATTEGTWLWSDGAQFWSGAAAGTAVGGLFTSWAGGEPNNAGGNEDCARYFAASTWGDAACTNTYYYVCEAY